MKTICFDIFGTYFGPKNSTKYKFAKYNKINKPAIKNILKIVT